MFVYNDGFLQRLASLSQENFTFQPELLEVLRKQITKEKAEELLMTIFLASLEMHIFTTFDPRGDESLVALQERMAETYISHNPPDSNDLTPLLEIFQENAAEQSLTAYSYLWSEILSSSIFVTLKNTDLSNVEEVKRLGHGVRNLFLRRDSHQAPLTLQEIEELIAKEVSPEDLRNVHNL